MPASACHRGKMSAQDEAITNIKKDLDDSEEKNQNDTENASPTGSHESSPAPIKIAVVPVKNPPAAAPDPKRRLSNQEIVFDHKVVAPQANVYCKMVAKRPLLLCLSLLIFNLGLAPIAVVIRGVPDFSDPKVGIEARGTLEAEAEHTFRVLIDTQKNKEGCKDTFCDEGDKVGDCSITFSIHETQCPEEEYQKHEVRRRLDGRMDNTHQEKQQQPWSLLEAIFSKHSAMMKSVVESVETRKLENSTGRCPGWTHGRKRLLDCEALTTRESACNSAVGCKWSNENETCVPDNGGSWHYYDINARTVGFAYGLDEDDDEDEGDMLDPAKLKSMCKTGKLLTSDAQFSGTFCLLNKDDEGSCCPPESLTSFVSFIAGKEDTCTVTQADAEKARELIGSCHEYRKPIIEAYTLWSMGMMEAVPTSRTNLDSSKEEEAGFLKRVNEELNKIDLKVCRDNYLELAGVYELLITEDWSPGNSIKSSNIFFPVIGIKDHDGSFFDLYYSALAPKMDAFELHAKGVAIGSSEGRFGVFDTDVMDQSKFAMLSFVIILGMMILHNGSWFISICAFGQIFLSLGLTFFLYQIVLWAPYFPFLNLVALFLLIAIGVDDVFIYYDTWSQSYHTLMEDTPLENRIHWVMRKAGSTMLTTTATTAVALLTNVVSAVTAVKLFGIFTFLAVVANYFLVMTMLPCTVLLGQEICRIKCMSSCKIRPNNGGPSKIEEFLTDSFGNLILYFRYPLILIMTAWGIFSFYEALHLPNPDNEDLPLWTTSHPLEVWNLEYKPHYTGTTVKGNGMMVRFNIGYSKEDTGNYLNPTINGRGAVDRPVNYFVDVNFAAKASQKFYLDVCEEAKKLFWVDPKVREHGSPEAFEFDISCWPLAFKKWQMVDESPQKCKKYPVEEADFYECLYDYLDDTQRWGVKNVFFHMGNKTMSSMHLYIQTTKEWRAVYNYMEDLFVEISGWTEARIKEAPAELKEVNWTSQFRYFGLQKALKMGAIWSSFLALIFALLAIIFMTRRVRLSILSVLSIFMMLSCVVANMKWMGWTIGINEAGVFSIAVGLSVDFVCHLAHAYNHAKYDDSIQMEEQEFRLRYALGTVGISVTAAALSTLIGACAMVLSVVLFFNRFGVYLVLAMAWSWLYSFFYFTSLVSLFGPRGEGSAVPLFFFGSRGKFSINGTKMKS